MKWIPTSALAVILASASIAHAGWLIREADPEFPDEVTTYRFQAGKVRIEGVLEGLTILIDLRKDEGYIVDPAAKKWAGGKIALLAEELKKLEIGAAAGESEPETSPPIKTELKDLGPGERFLGYETRHYEVRVDGDLIEEFWAAPKIDVEAEVDLAAFTAAMQKMLGGGAGVNQGYEDNPEYRKARKTGYPLKQILYFVGEKSTLAVKQVEIKGFAETDFAVPAGYTKTGYLELLVGESE